MATEKDNTKVPSKKTSKSIITNKDNDLSTFAINVASVWENNNQITLLWKSAAQFKLDAENYVGMLGSKKNKTKNRPQISNDLKKCNKAIDLGISKIKKYIDADAQDKNEAKASYAKFGIVHIQSNYILPFDKDSRAQALKLILGAIKEFGYENKTYGTAYFTPLIAEFNSLVETASNTDKSISTITGNKNELKKNLLLVLNSLVKVIQANYPETYKTELRAWGFQKEKY